MKYKVGDLVVLNPKEPRNHIKLQFNKHLIFEVTGFDDGDTIELKEINGELHPHWYPWRLIPYVQKTKEQKILDKINYLYSISKCSLEKKWITKHD